MHLEKEYADKLAANTSLVEQRVRAKTQAEFSIKVETLEKETFQKNQKIQEMEKLSLTLAQKEKELK